MLVLRCYLKCTQSLYQIHYISNRQLIEEDLAHLMRTFNKEQCTNSISNAEQSLGNMSFWPLESLKLRNSSHSQQCTHQSAVKRFPRFLPLYSHLLRSFVFIFLYSPFIWCICCILISVFWFVLLKTFGSHRKTDINIA